jgi:NADH:ubiquinone oxidoreductase subunit D
MAAIQNAQAVCSRAIQDLNSSAQKLNNRYRDAGQRWRDNKYTQLGGIIDDCSRALKSPVEELFDCLQKLNEIEKVLFEYESVNLR